MTKSSYLVTNGYYHSVTEHALHKDKYKRDPLYFGWVIVANSR